MFLLVETEVKTLSVVAKINAFSLSKKSSFIYWKKNSPSPTRKTNGLADPNKKSYLESIPSHKLYQVLQHNLKDGLLLRAIYHVFHSKIIYHVFRG